MKTNSQTPNTKLWVGALGFALLLLAMCPQNAEAQSNTFPSTGNVGIGTTTPSAPLEINTAQNGGTTLVVDNGYNTGGNQAYSGLFFKQAGANRFALTTINDGNSVQTGGPGAVQLWNFANGPMLFATNSAERVRIDPAGNVGIGTTSLPNKFNVEFATSGGWNGIRINNTSGHHWGFLASDSAASPANSLMLYDVTAGVQRLTIAGNGSVGIGTTTPGRYYWPSARES